MILAAGLGTRLLPLTEEKAKALVPVGDRSVLAHVAGALAGFDRIAVNAHHRAAEVEIAARELGLACSIETDLLGTAGGIARARARGLVSGDVLVWNADILGDFDVGALAAHHGGAATLLAVRRPKGEGTMGVAKDGRVVRLRKTNLGDEASGADFVGVHVVSSSLALPDSGCIVGDVYIPALARGEIHAHYTNAAFVDVGSIAGYLAANRAWLARQGVRSWTGADAKVSCVLEDSIVGEGAEATGPGALVRCVVWPGAHARAPLTDAVVTPHRTIG
jgi:NDP-sugar pyrophosphorylase family protein